MQHVSIEASGGSAALLVTDISDPENDRLDLEGGQPQILGHQTCSQTCEELAVLE